STLFPYTTLFRSSDLHGQRQPHKMGWHYPRTDRGRQRRRAGAPADRQRQAALPRLTKHQQDGDSMSVNLPTHDFYRGTRRTLELAYVRPRHNGYMAFQQAAADRLGECLRARASATSIIADLNR